MYTLGVSRLAPTPHTPRGVSRDLQIPQNHLSLLPILGVYTGSLYNRAAYGYFQGETECPTNQSVFVVKTNEFGASAGRIFKPQCRRTGMRDITFDKAIYMIRNPFNSFVATYNHQITNNTELPVGKALLKPRKYTLNIWHGVFNFCRSLTNNKITKRSS